MTIPTVVSSGVMAVSALAASVGLQAMDAERLRGGEFLRMSDKRGGVRCLVHVPVIRG